MQDKSTWEFMWGADPAPMEGARFATNTNVGAAIQWPAVLTAVDAEDDRSSDAACAVAAEWREFESVREAAADAAKAPTRIRLPT